MVKLSVKKDKLTIEEGENSFVGKLIAGTKGKIRIKTPFEKREIKTVKKASEK